MLYPSHATQGEQLFNVMFLCMPETVQSTLKNTLKYYSYQNGEVSEIESYTC